MRFNRAFVLCSAWAILLVLSGCQPIQPISEPLVEAPAPTAVTMDAAEEGLNPSSLAGEWSGSLTVAGITLDIAVMFEESEDGLRATIDIPQQGADDLPLHDIEVAYPAVKFELLEGPQLALFDGTVNDDGSMSGDFTQSGMAGSFELVRAAPDTLTNAAEDASADAGIIYADPTGRFTVPVPANWLLTEAEDYATLTSPEGGMTVYVLALEDSDLEEAVAAAWARINPDFDLEVQEVIEHPTQQVEQVITVVFDTGEEERFVLADAILAEGVAYLTLYDGDLETVQRRLSQLQIISSGLDILGVEQTDLAGVAPRSIDDALLADLETYIISALEQYKVPGAAVSIVQDGEIVYAEGFGIRDPATGEPVTPETRMMIGSTSKTLTTLLMAALVDAGLMSWDTPVADVLPDFAVADPELSEEITLENLVCACTGVPRRDLELVFNGEGMTAEDVIESLQSFEFYTDFGEAFQYSNQMVAAGGYAAAAADGGDFGDLYDAYEASVQARVLGPMGMGATTLSLDDVIASENYAIPHTLNLDMSYTPAPMAMESLFLDPIAPAGAYWSNVLDMARYLQMQLADGIAPDGTVVVSPENLAITRTPQVPISADASYGLGWIVNDYKGQLMIEHGGNTLGFTSDLAFLPEAGVGISVLTNGRVTNFFNEGVRYRLLELLFDQPQNADTQIAFSYGRLGDAYAEMSADLSETLDEAAVAPFLGRFTNEALGEIELSVVADEAGLEVDTGGFQVTMRPLVEDSEADDGVASQSFLVVEAPLTGAVLELTVDEAGTPIVVIGQGVEEYVFTPVAIR